MNQNDRQAPRLTVPVRAIGFFRRFHYTQLFLHALFSCLFIVGCAIWINYRAIFQSGIIGFSHLLTGVLCAGYITSRVIEEFIAADTGVATPTTPAQAREIQRQRREYFVFKRLSPAIIVIGVIAVIFSVMYLYNLIYILANICPSLQTHSAHFTHAASIQGEEEEVISTPSVIEITVAYEHVPRNEKYVKRNVLLLKYDTQRKQVVRKTKTMNPNVDYYNQWFVQNEVLGYDTMHGHIVKGAATTSFDALKSTLFCINRTGEAIYSFVENELTHTLYKNLKEREDTMSMRIVDKSNTYTAYMYNKDEQDMDIHLLTREICRNEYAFVIGVIVFLMLWDILIIFTVCYNIWLVRT